MTLLLDKGRVIDGTGAPWYRGSVKIANGRVESVGRGHQHGLSAKRTVDLEGAVVCPGFIDLHSHADLEILRDPLLEPKIRQGVTTEIVGQDGFSCAPIDGTDRPDEWEHYLRGLLGELDQAWPGKDIAEYLETVEEMNPAPNIATLVGHGTVRYNVMGWEPRPATDPEVQEMSALVADGLRQGAIGISTGLEYPPQLHAKTSEVRTLAEELAPYGLPFVAHIRSYREEMWNALEEFINIGGNEIPVHLSHFKLGATKRGKANRALHLARAARERGIDFTADLYPYSPGSTMLQSLMPTWAHAEGPERLIERLQNDDDREEMKRELAEDGGNWDFEWNEVRISNVDSASNEEYLGMTIREIAAEQRKDPVDVICDLLVEEDLAVTAIIGAIEDGDDEDICRVISSELVGIGTDGIFGDQPHPRVYGTYPRVLGEYVRERSLFSLEEGVRKMTSLPARIMGLDQKGVVRPGMDADLVVFRPNHVGSDATVNQPNRFPSGIDHVLVNGEFVVRGGEVTENRPGGPIRNRFGRSE